MNRYIRPYNPNGRDNNVINLKDIAFFDCRERNDGWVVELSTNIQGPHQTGIIFKGIELDALYVYEKLTDWLSSDHCVDNMFVVRNNLPPEARSKDEQVDLNNMVLYFLGGDLNELQQRLHPRYNATIQDVVDSIEYNIDRLKKLLEEHKNG